LEAARRTGARKKKINLRKTGRRAVKNRPSVILGTWPEEEEKKWRECDLSKILVKEDLLSQSTALETKDFATGKVEVPKQLGFGVGAEEEKMLLDSLPLLTANMAQAQQGKLDSESYEKNLETQWHIANEFAKVLDLRNANAKGISYVNRRRIIFAFSTPQNPFDTGRTEVQGTVSNQVHQICHLLNFTVTVALLTYKIRNLWKHLTTSKKDTGNRRNLRVLVHERARLLRYLKRISRSRYEILLKKLSLEPDSVEGELVV
jgi:small subunit ribosomal protein S15